MSKFSVEIFAGNPASIVETVEYGETTQADVLTELAKRDSAEEIYIITRSDKGKKEWREQWTPAHVTEYLDLMARMANQFSLFSPLTHFVPGTESDGDERKTK